MAFVFMADCIDTTRASRSAAVLLGIIGMASIIGHLGLGALAGRLGILRLYQLSFLGLALSFLIWIIADTSYALLIAFAVVLAWPMAASSHSHQRWWPSYSAHSAWVAYWEPFTPPTDSAASSARQP